MSGKQNQNSNLSAATALSSPSPTTWMIVAGSVGLTVLGQYSWTVLMRRLLRNGHPEKNKDPDTTAPPPSRAVFESDATYLQRAHELRLALTTPVQSRFRVVAILVLDDAQATCIYGANDEPSPAISGSICAERGAFLQYRLQQTEMAMGQDNQNQQQQQSKPPMVHRIFIVTDSTVAPVPPGLLCREYMMGHPAMTPTTPIVLQSANQQSTPWITTLQELYPYPSLTMQWSVEEHLARGQAFAKLKEKDASFKYQVISTSTSSSFTAHHVQQVMEAAQTAAQQWDIRDAVHPIRYGAAALTWRQGQDDQTWRILHRASQRKALEYGATQDAVTQLLSILWDDEHDKNDKHNPPQHLPLQKQQKAADSKDIPKNDDEPQQPQSILLAQVDQFGMVYAPFAPARSMLVEHGWGDTVFVVVPEAAGKDNDDDLTTTSETTTTIKLPVASIVPARALAPYTPEWK